MKLHWLQWASLLLPWLPLLGRRPDVGQSALCSSYNSRAGRARGCCCIFKAKACLCCLLALPWHCRVPEAPAPVIWATGFCAGMITTQEMELVLQPDLITQWGIAVDNLLTTGIVAQWEEVRNHFKNKIKANKHFLSLCSRHQLWWVVTSKPGTGGQNWGALPCPLLCSSAPQASGRREQAPMPPVLCLSSSFDQIASKDGIGTRRPIAAWNHRGRGSGFLLLTAASWLIMSVQLSISQSPTFNTWRAFRNRWNCMARGCISKYPESVICIIPKGVCKLMHVWQECVQIAQFVYTVGGEAAVVSHINLSDGAASWKAGVGHMASE